jgi:deoxyribose-phosphate aldolase
MELPQPLNRYIDHTLLKPDATLEDFQQLIEEAIEYNFASVCVSPHMALPAVDALKDYPNVKVCTVVGFPHGNLPYPLKVSEAEYFVQSGVDEIDFVINVGLLKSGMYENVGDEIETMGLVCRDNGAVSKCIIETCYLTEDEKTFMYRALAERTAVNYIKTSTGYGPAGADLRDVFTWNQRRYDAEAVQDSVQDSGLLILQSTTATRNTYIMRNGEPLKIKAAGGIRDLETALKFIACGADRLGMSASVKVMEEWNDHGQTFTEGEEKG